MKKCKDFPKVTFYLEIILNILLNFFIVFDMEYSSQLNNKRERDRAFSWYSTKNIQLSYSFCKKNIYTVHIFHIFYGKLMDNLTKNFMKEHNKLFFNEFVFETAIIFV